MKWSVEDIEILKNNMHKTDAELAIELNRKENSVKCKRIKLGYFKKSHVIPWTEDEINILKEHAANSYAKDLKKLLPRHSEDGIMHKCKRLKIHKSKEFMSAHGKMYIGRPDRIIKHFYKLDQSFTIDDL